ncbi:MAG TPA: outer membrane protein assembly factor BamD [Burkholderiales bacterium]
MKRSVAAAACSVLALALAGCGLFPDKVDPADTWPANRLYKEAKDELDGGNYDQAIKYYEKLESRYPYGRYAQQAQLEIAYAYYKQGEQASGVAAIDRFIKLHPNHANVDYAYYLKGLIYFNEDQGFLGKISDQNPAERDPKAPREAFDAFRELVQRYPESKYAPDAVARMKYLVNALASHEVFVARYYVKRGAWVAAINRAQYALQNYPESPACEEALFIMVQAYDALGMKQLSGDAARVLRQNFPKTRYFASEDVTGPWWKVW